MEEKNDVLKVIGTADEYVMLGNKKVNLSKITVLAYNSNLSETLILFKTRKGAYLLGKSNLKVITPQKLISENVFLIEQISGEVLGKYLIEWKEYEVYEEMFHHIQEM